jgi:Zn-dependent peptidase ImmA (M78 family)
MLDKTLISQEAAHLLQQSGAERFPIDLRNIANYLGYTIRKFIPEGEWINISGAVFPKVKKIFVNNNDTYLRQRFTIAHELGHIILHRRNSQEEFVDYRGGPIKSSEDAIKEYEADEFAASLLMPEDLFKAKYYELRSNFEALSDYFGVTTPAIGMRARNLELD